MLEITMCHLGLDLLHAGIDASSGAGPGLQRIYPSELDLL